jgi:hypothetical protein
MMAYILPDLSYIGMSHTGDEIVFFKNKHTLNITLQLALEIIHYSHFLDYIYDSKIFS